MDFFESLNESLRRAEEHNERKRMDHERMLAEPCSKTIEAGNRVLVRADMLGAGCGFAWELRECLVVQVANYGLQVSLQSRYGRERGPDFYWIGRELVVDVLPPSDVPIPPQ